MLKRFREGIPKPKRPKPIPETDKLHLKMDGWNTFLFGWPIEDHWNGPPIFSFYSGSVITYFFSIFFLRTWLCQEKTSPKFCDVKHDLFLRSWSRVGGCLARGSGRVSVDTLRWSSHTKTSHNGEKNVVIIILQGLVFLIQMGTPLKFIGLNLYFTKKHPCQLDRNRAIFAMF